MLPSFSMRKLRIMITTPNGKVALSMTALAIISLAMALIAVFMMVNAKGANEKLAEELSLTKQNAEEIQKRLETQKRILQEENVAQSNIFHSVEADFQKSLASKTQELNALSEESQRIRNDKDQLTQQVYDQIEKNRQLQHQIEVLNENKQQNLVQYKEELLLEKHKILRELFDEDEARKPHNLDLELYQLLRKVQVDGIVYVTIFDSMFFEVAQNWVKFADDAGITNYIVCTTEFAPFELLQAMGVNSYFNPSFGLGGASRLLLTAHILSQGFDIFFVDTDAVILQNPTPYIRENLKDNDFLIQCDDPNGCIKEPKTMNPGMVFMKSVRKVISFLHSAAEILSLNPLSGKSPLFSWNELFNQNHCHASSLKWDFLNVFQFPNGVIYYTTHTTQRKNEKAIIVHNNHLSGIEAKKYRFREYNQWQMDADSYFQQSKNYLSYSLANFESATWEDEKKTLSAALSIANVLGRVLILPEFKCRYQHHAMFYITELFTPDTMKCTLDDAFDVAAFFSTFKNVKEHSFLQNEQTSSAVKTDVIKVFFSDASAICSENIDGITFDDSVTDVQLKEKLSPYQSVTHINLSCFHYTQFSGLENVEEQRKFAATTNNGLVMQKILEEWYKTVGQL